MASLGMRPLLRCLHPARLTPNHCAPYHAQQQQSSSMTQQQQQPVQQTRALYTAQSLGMDKFVEQRERVKAQFGPDKERFMARIREYFRPIPAEIEKEGTAGSSSGAAACDSGAVSTANSSGSNAMVFTEDLKNVVSLCESDDDIDLCVRMMRRFNEQTKSLRFGTFVFGPVAIRLLYVLDKPDLAIQVLKDPQLAGFFDQFSSYQIAMDLLYKKGRYDDVLDLYQHMRQQQLHGTRFPRDCVVLVLGACYQISTKESYEFALKLIREARQSGALVLRKGLTFTAALALNMNEPKLAMELLALTAQINYITVRNLRLIALSHLDRYEDIFLVLRSIIHQYHHLRQGDSEICQDTLDRIHKNLEKKGDTERLQLFSQLQRALKEGNHLSTSTIDELLNRPMQQKSRDTNPPLAMFRDHRSFPSPDSPSATLRRPSLTHGANVFVTG
ncbi:pentatricopeptide repeat-containing protein 2, mitochondrial-like isoform X2 [Varroa jacobsoni]|uniref:pentatricopeptide repeat-containing protein 2, mitochondrial-like isoform X2 n=1 Tax=Varroa jacobsoni TaxID=62625 RepID=UPI000BF3227E|nr:pentatricopeptide repeat-containing protein 2, mitochondrial-like isoform X2 [Varroa jacobsoni]